MQASKNVSEHWHNLSTYYSIHFREPVKQSLHGLKTNSQAEDMVSFNRWRCCLSESEYALMRVALHPAFCEWCACWPGNSFTSLLIEGLLFHFCGCWCFMFLLRRQCICKFRLCHYEAIPAMAMTKHRFKHKWLDKMLILMDNTNPMQIFGVSPFFKAAKQQLDNDRCKYAYPVTVCRILPDTAAIL